MVTDTDQDLTSSSSEVREDQEDRDRVDSVADSVVQDRVDLAVQDQVDSVVQDQAEVSEVQTIAEATEAPAAQEVPAVNAKANGSIYGKF